MKDLRFRHGRLLYRKKSTGEERGREVWQLTRNRDDSRTLRSLAATDDSQFLRDVTYTVGPDQRPRDAYVRLQVGRRWIGSGYFHLENELLTIVCDGAETGHTHQVVRVPEQIHIMTHAVMLDGWTFWTYDEEIGGEQVLTVYNTSTRWNGVDGPLGRLEGVKVAHVGEEEIEVPAGTFATRRFRIESDLISSPPAEIWISGEDLLLVKYDWGELDLEYVLDSMTEG